MRRRVEIMQPAIEMMTSFDGRSKVERKVLVSLPRHIPEL